MTSRHSDRRFHARSADWISRRHITE